MSSVFVTSEDIESISRDFWSSMVDVDLRPAQNGSMPEAGDSIVGHIDINGAWLGVIEIRASRGVARATASSLLNKRRADVTTEECFDAVQEAANIVAGSIKRLLPSVCFMGLPEVSDSKSDAVMLQCSDVLEVCFLSSSGPLAIAVGSRDHSSQ